MRSNRWRTCPGTIHRRIGPARATFGSRRVTRAALVGLLALSVVGTLLGRRGNDAVPMTARLAADPSTRLAQSADLDRVQLILTLTNSSPGERRVDRIEVTGLGQVSVGAPGPWQVPGGGSLRLPLAVTADCAVLSGSHPAVVIDGIDNGAPAGDPQALLSPMCPRPVPGLAVDVVAARAQGADSFAVRLVNHGAVTATVSAVGPPGTAAPRLSTTPALPMTLGPGGAATVDVRADLTRCPDGSDLLTASTHLGLRAGAPADQEPVGGWPTALVRSAVQEAARRCTTS